MFYLQFLTYVLPSHRLNNKLLKIITQTHLFQKNRPNMCGLVFVTQKDENELGATTYLITSAKVHFWFLPFIP